MSAITATDLQFTYPNSDFSLSLPAWSVEPGQRCVLHGPSGCGKSTLLNLVAGALVPTGGTLSVLGRDVGAMSPAERRAHRIQRIGFIFQDYPLVDYLGATDNVLLPFRVNPALTLDAGARDRASGLLDELGLAGKHTRRPDQLSQGERQRVAIARALVTEPALLLADEPTTGLDPARSAQVMELLEGLCAQRGVTLLLVTHDPVLRARFDHALELP